MIESQCETTHLSCRIFSFKFMKKLNFLLTAVVVATTLVGCASSNNSPVSYRDVAKGSTMCLVDNTELPPQMFLAVRRALLDKGFYVQRVDENHLPSQANCRQIISYEMDLDASWGQPILNFARITLKEQSKIEKVYTAQFNGKKGQPTLFDQVREADIEIRRLIDRLLPSDIPWS